jgi:tetratricopeptide (TPR) repeat protein
MHLLVEVAWGTYRIVLISSGHQLIPNRKSQLAISYGYKITESSPDTWVFWVDAENVTKFEQGYRDIANAVRIPGRNDRDADILSLVYNWLRDITHGDWVMILDNADDKEVFTSLPTRLRQTEAGKQIRDFLPQSSNGSILVTSRSRDAAYQVTCNYRHILAVEPMTEMESMALLQSQLEDTHPEDEMKLLGETLGFVPLALSQAAANISRRSLPIADYLEELKKGNERLESLLDESSPQLRRDSGRSNSIVATWKVTFEYVRRTTPSAARLLSLMCLFNRQDIPETLLQAQYGEEVNAASSKPRKPWWRRRPRSKRRKEQMATAKMLPCDFEDDWLTLRDFSLIKLNKDRRHFSMHPMVQFTTKKWLVLHSELDAWSYKFISVMNTHFPDPEHTSFKLCEPLISHAYAAVPYRPTDDATPSLHEWATLTSKVANYYDHRTALDTAQKLYQAAASAFETTLGVNAPQSLKCHCACATALFHMGREPESESLHRRVLALRTTSLGPEHSDTLASMDHLGVALAALNRHNEAEILHVRALDTRLKTLGPAHDASQRALDKRGIFLLGRSRYADADAAWTQAYAARSASCKDTFDPQRANELDLLGLRRLMSGAWLDAGRFFELAVAEKEKAPPGAALMQSLANLARVRTQQADLYAADALFARALTCPCAPARADRMQIAHEHASVLLALNRLGDAAVLARTCLAERVEALGPKHRDVFESMWLVGCVCEKQGRLEDAGEMLGRAWEGAREVLGEGHGDVKEYAADWERVREILAKVGDEEEDEEEDTEAGAQEDVDGVGVLENQEREETDREMAVLQVPVSPMKNAELNETAERTNARLELVNAQASLGAMQEKALPIRIAHEGLERTPLLAS